MDEDLQARDILIATAIKFKGDWELIYKSVLERKHLSYDETHELLKQIHSKAVTIIDPDYPMELKMRCHRPPWVIFYEGDLSLLSDPYRILTIVGSRDASEYGKRKVAEYACAAAEEGYIIASGLAKGIDAAALSAAVNYPGKAIAVLGNGIEYFYPLENKELQKRISEVGLLLSEYPGKTPPSPHHFPFRNRILAVISQTLLVGEAHAMSGTLTTVAYALSYNRDVGAIPFRSDDESANNRLIKTGAAMVDTKDDLLLLLSHSAPPLV